ncbi:hypothetical protein [Streptomyces sp. BPTC-684]|uniref:hypothetical protein n=1 Tax=Streptomyces sp. BPTC-684 TaxID=3043734 RepID=UPI0024B1A8B9|nr:hypothetical protein [Streptomyces sp. BPTC-684]WHM40650.1 hypothetical protein QIY60_29780 [Streptomyces sp. BPTC-684]
MTTALTILVMVFLIIGAAGLIHRLNAQHAERITLHRYSRFAPGRQGDRDSTAQPVPGKPEPLAVPARRDQRDGGRGRLRPRRRIRHAHGH